MKKRILLHLCCAPCGTESLRRLQELGEVVLFFSNANIFPRGEFAKRLREARKLARIGNCKLVIDKYDHAEWLQFISGMESEPENGQRCQKCFGFSLKRTAEYATKKGFDAFTTSLTISPHKNSMTVFAIGKAISDRFLEIDFKKKDGFQRSLDYSRQYAMYRQNYCGCEFSMRSAEQNEDVPRRPVTNGKDEL